MNSEYQFNIFLDYHNKHDLLKHLPLQLVSSYFRDYYKEHDIKSTIVDLMKWANTNTNDYNEFIQKLHSGSTIIQLIVKSHNLSLLKWFFSSDCILTHNRLSMGLNIGFEVGSLDILKWGFDMGITYSWDNFHTAIQFGHLPILQWMHQDKIIQKSFKQYKYKFFDWNHFAMDTECCTTAIRYNQTEILNWLWSERYPVNLGTLAETVKVGNMYLFEWLWDEHIRPRIQNDWENLQRLGVINGRLDVIKWLREKNTEIEWDDDLAFEAVSEGHVEILKYISDNNLPVAPQGLCNAAAILGKTDVMKWCIDRGSMIDPSTPIKAAEHGNVEVFKWMLDQGHCLDLDMEQIIKILLKILSKNNNLNHLEILRIVHPIYLVRYQISANHELNDFDTWMIYIRSVHKPSIQADTSL